MSLAVAQSLRPGLTLADRYRLVRPIGRGGMGSVWEVVHARLGRQFALKVMGENLMDDAQSLVRFRREADLIASLRHPNIIEIVDLVDLDNGLPCIVMEYLEGEDLSDRIKRVGPLDWPTIAMVGEQMLLALSVAHGQGIVHRDLKPNNIFIAIDATGREHSKLLDFGLSKSLSLHSLTVSSTSGIGTPAYMAPEQADERLGKIGPLADVWAMGILLFEMATGKLPFMGESPVATLYQICHGEPLSMTDLRPDAPAEFVKVIEGALQRDPEARWPSVDVFREEIARALEPVADVSRSARRLESSQEFASGKVRRKVRDTSAMNDTMLDIGASPAPSSAAQEVTATGLVAVAPRRLPMLAAIIVVAVGLVAAAVLTLGGRETAADKNSKTAPALDQPETKPGASEPTRPVDVVAPVPAKAPEEAAQAASVPTVDAESPQTPSAVAPESPESSAQGEATPTKKPARQGQKTRANSSAKNKPAPTARERGKPLDPF